MNIDSKRIQALEELLVQAIRRVEIANAEGNPILSAWLPEAKKAMRLYPDMVPEHPALAHG